MRPARRPPSHRIARFLAVLPAVALLVAAGCNHPEATATAPTAEPSAEGLLPVTVAMQTWPQTVTVQGTLLGFDRVTIAAKVAGRVQQVHFDLGDQVRPGDKLAVLELEEFRFRVEQAGAQIAQVRAKLGLGPEQSLKSFDARRVPAVLQEEILRNEARLNLDRANQLIEGQAISLEELQKREALMKVAEARYVTALNQVREQVEELAGREAELKLAQEALDDATIVAPTHEDKPAVSPEDKGVCAVLLVVEERHVAPGAYVQVGQPVATLVRVDKLRFHAGVPERLAMLVREKQSVAIRIEGREKPLAATIARISPAVDPANRSLTIEADVANGDFQLRAGLFAVGEIVVDPAATALVVPADAIGEFAGVEKVRLIREGKAVEQPVRTGRRREGWIEVLEGLKPGDQVAAGQSGA